MDVNKRIGIIIPAFNVEQYIERAIVSCVNQTYSNIEIIVVDDGSTDNTYEIAKKLSKLDDRICVYRQKNSGVSVARNYGLDNCMSDYVIFLDSDDWIEENTIQRLVDHISTDTERCLVCADAYYAYSGNDGIWKKRAPYIASAVEMHADEALFYVTHEEYKLRSACYKLFAMEVINENKLRFDDQIKHGEDGLFVFEYLKCVHSFIYFPEPLWNILERSTSATHAPYNKSWLTAIDAVDKMIAYNNNKDLDIELQNYRVRRMIAVLCQAILNIHLAEKDVKYLKKELIKEFKRYIKTEKKVKYRLFYIFVIFMPPQLVALYCRRGK